MDRRARIVPVVLAAALALVAFACSSQRDPDATRGVAAAAAPATPATVAVAPDGTEHVTLVIKTDTEHGLMGLDGMWHDAFLPASFTAQVGVPVTVTVLNYDGGWHSFTAPGLGLDVFLKAGRPSHPATTTFTFTPKTAGVVVWFCKAPCDPWAMARLGYMQGAVRVLPPAV